MFKLFGEQKRIVWLGCCATLLWLSACADDEKKFPSEGTQSAPIAVALSSLPRTSTVGEVRSFYQVFGVTASSYTVRLRELNEPVNLLVYQDAFFSTTAGNLLCSHIGSTTTVIATVSCAASATPTSGALYLVVQPLNYKTGSQFILEIN